LGVGVMVQDMCKACVATCARPCLLVWADVEASVGHLFGGVGGPTQADTARLYEVSAATVSRWVARWRIEGEAAFEPRSRRPRTSPNRISGTVIELIVDLRRTLTAEGLDAGPETIGWYLQRHHDVVVSVSTIRRYLVAKGLVSMASGICPVADSRTARWRPAELPAGGQVFCPQVSWSVASSPFWRWLG